MAAVTRFMLSSSAMNGGEDYELLFTVPLHAHEEIKKIPGVHVIGHITKPELGEYLETRDGTEIPLRAQGFNHMAPTPDSTADQSAETKA